MSNNPDDEQGPLPQPIDDDVLTPPEYTEEDDPLYDRNEDPAYLFELFQRQDLERHLIYDYVNTWKTLLDHRTDAHWCFKEITGLFLLSAIVSGQWQFMDFSRASIDESGNIQGGLFLNLWVMMLGKSRIARKTTVIRYVTDMIRKLSYNQEVPTGNGDETISINMLLPHEFNPASFVRIMNQRDVNGVCYASWIDDEVSRFYEQMGTANYMAGIAPALSRLYEPLDSYSRSTIDRGTEEIRRSYFTVLTASTMSLPQLFSEREIMQGFLNRFMFILDDIKDRVDRLDPQQAIINISDVERKIIEWLEAIRDASTISVYIIPNSEEKEYYRAYEKKINKMIREDEINELYQGYVANLPDFLLKIASLYRISRIPYHIIIQQYTKSTNGVRIEMEDLKRAEKLVDLLFENFKKVVRLSRKKTTLGVTYSQDSDLIIVYDAIENCTDKKTKYATRSDVLRKTKMRSKVLENVIGALLEMECIRVDWSKPIGTGRRTQLLKAILPPL